MAAGTSEPAQGLAGRRGRYRIHPGPIAEDARFIFPNAMQTNLIMTVNLRQLIHMSGLRLCTMAQWEIRQLFKQIRQGDGPQDMVDGGVLNGLPRTWKDPYRFLYAAARGLWGNHNKLDPDVV